MSISTSWNDDGALVIRCGSEELEIPPSQLTGKGGSSAATRSSGAGLVVGFLPDITPGKRPKVVCQVAPTVTAPKYPSIDTMAGLREAIRQAMAETTPQDELFFGWNSKEEISIADVREIIDVQRAKHLTIQLFPTFPKPGI